MKTTVTFHRVTVAEAACLPAQRSIEQNEGKRQDYAAIARIRWACTIEDTYRRVP